jgi:hypothetical protein
MLAAQVGEKLSRVKSYLLANFGFRSSSRCFTLAV